MFDLKCAAGVYKVCKRPPLRDDRSIDVAIEGFFPNATRRVAPLPRPAIDPSALFCDCIRFKLTLDTLDETEILAGLFRDISESNILPSR